MSLSKLATATLIVSVAAGIAGCGGSSGGKGGKGPSANPAPLGSALQQSPQAPGQQGQPGQGQPPPVGPSAQAWQTPRVSTGSGASLENQTPNNVCRAVWAPYPVRIERFAIDKTGGPDPRPFLNPESENQAVRAGAKFAGLSYQPVSDCPGSKELGTRGAQKPCAADTVISLAEPCGIIPYFTEADPQPARPARYTFNITWYLSKLCTDATTGPCQSLQGAQPGPGRPVRATWQSTTIVTACVVWVDAPGLEAGGEGEIAQC
ncbi:hypothetical protein [Spirillospora sp. CA-128828]|uniref:hypothetical protein n=1 Tax=Spirillospora sp. CA-128828 TaxID=3240033 RepID=UPI003D939BF2